MFEPGALIMYGNTGVCRVESIAPMEGRRGVVDKNRHFYKLLPLHSSGVIYVPVDTNVFMRPVLNREEALDLIRRIPEIEIDFDEAENHDWHTLSAAYQKRIQSHSCEALVQLIKAVYRKMRISEKMGKRLYKVDQDYKKRAEELLHSELAAALDIPVADVPCFIAEELQNV